MPQECTNNPCGTGNYCENQSCCSPQSRPGVVYPATKIPKTLMWPATSKALESFLPLHPEEILVPTEAAEYVYE